MAIKLLKNLNMNYLHKNRYQSYKTIAIIADIDKIDGDKELKFFDTIYHENPLSVKI